MLLLLKPVLMRMLLPMPMPWEARCLSQLAHAILSQTETMSVQYAVTEWTPLNRKMPKHGPPEPRS